MRDRVSEEDAWGRDPEDVDISRRGPDPADLTPLDWVLCVLCSGIACIIGIIRLIQGKPNAGKMIAVSLAFVILWTIIRFALSAATR